ncbi:hypothetical protein SAMN03159424_06084 [Pseudomonas sp. NFACC05-1]|nr:hypothetical protein SAMN03159424_06084 [Pseudomonas sp. NFACC05-1]
MVKSFCGEGACSRWAAQQPLLFTLNPPNPMIPHHLPLGFCQKPAYPPPHICEPTPRTDKADHFLTKSHSRPQEPDVRFEGW